MERAGGSKTMKVSEKGASKCVTGYPLDTSDFHGKASDEFMEGKLPVAKTGEAGGYSSMQRESSGRKSGKMSDY